MAEIIDIETRKAAERRLALLALTGEPSESSGSCLDAETLACLVEGRLQADSVEACLGHLAECEHCYAAWRQLDQEWQHKAGKRGRSRGKLLDLFRRPRLVAAAGSILAVAASIALFVNITTHTDRTTLLPLPTTPAQEQQIAPPAQSAPEPVHKQPQILEQPAAPAPAPMQKEKKALSRTDRVQTPEQEAAATAKAKARDADRGPSARQARPPAESAAPDNTMGTASADKLTENKGEPADMARMEAAPAPPHQDGRLAGGLSENAAAADPLTLAEWQRMIRAGCLGQPGPEFFAGITAQGRRLLARHETAQLPQEDRRRISRILALLADQNRLTPDRQCRALLQQLGPAAGTNKQ